MTRPNPKDDQQDADDKGQDDGSQGYDSETSVRKGLDPGDVETK